MIDILPNKNCFRVGWHPVGMYGKQRNRGATFCYTIITIALLAGTVAVVVSWLLATGIIDPDPQTTNKEGRKLDIFRNPNTLERNIKTHHTNTESSENHIDEHNKAVVQSFNETQTSLETEDIETAILKKIESEILNTSTNQTNDITDQAKVVEDVTGKEEIKPEITTDNQDITDTATEDTNTEPFTLASAVTTQQTTATAVPKDETLASIIETATLPENNTDYNTE